MAGLPQYRSGSVAIWLQIKPSGSGCKGYFCTASANASLLGYACYDVECWEIPEEARRLFTRIGSSALLYPEIIASPEI